MTTFTTVIDPKEMDLIDKVAKHLDPDAWDDERVFKEDKGRITVDVPKTITQREFNRSIRESARKDAAAIIQIIRDHDAAKEGT